MDQEKWRIFNPSGKRRIIVTRELPGTRWLSILKEANCIVEIWVSDSPPTIEQIKRRIGNRCDGAIGQLTETWGDELFAALKQAGGKVFSNYAVGFNNVDLNSASAYGIPVGNTPGVLTETTAEMAVALTFTAARRLGEAERFTRGGRFTGWSPKLFLGKLLWRKTLGVIGAGRIGSTYAKMMIEGHKMNLLYFNRHPNEELESYMDAYGNFLQSLGEKPVAFKHASSIEEVLQKADCVSLHTVLNESTRGLINGRRLALMKKDAILVNTSRGPVIDEAALVSHCENNPNFRAGLDVFEDEPSLKPGLTQLENVVVAPHIASATEWTRKGMAVLAAFNIASILQGFPVWNRSDVSSFLSEKPEKAAPSILNANELGLPIYSNQT